MLRYLENLRKNKGIKKRHVKVRKTTTKQSSHEYELQKSELEIKFDEFRDEVKIMFKNSNESFDKKIIAFEKISSYFKEMKKKMN